MPILFCNVGWMENYKGLGSGDAIRRGGAYVENEGRGHEICNFSPDNDGTLYGFVQPHGTQINIDRIGGNGREFVEGVTVVWLAGPPDGGTVIVGWYKNATVFRNYQRFTITPQSQEQNGIDGYWIKAPFDEARLLSVDARLLQVPRGVHGGTGQSNIWYAESPESAQLLRDVDYLVKNGHILSVSAGNRGKKQDQERKAAVEDAAIRACRAHFENLGYEINSVENDNVGWDLEAKANISSL